MRKCDYYLTGSTDRQIVLYEKKNPIVTFPARLNGYSLGAVEREANRIVCERGGFKKGPF